MIHLISILCEGVREESILITIFAQLVKTLFIYLFIYLAIKTPCQLCQKSIDYICVGPFEDSSNCYIDRFVYLVYLYIDTIEF